MGELSIGAKLAITMFFVVLNGFFVAAEFALVKVRSGRIDALARQGNRRALATQHILANLDLYLSGCQLGITVASLVLGWLAEPAVAALIIAGIEAFGWSADGPIVHGVSLVVALSVITTLHMTVGEQAPKIWALQKSESTSLFVAYPLRVFVTALRPLIWLVNQISNGMLRLVGARGGADHDSIHDLNEIKEIIQASATAGQISGRQRVFANNVLGLVNLEIRHILMPRVDTIFLCLKDPLEENLEIIRTSGHSRFPLCEVGLDTVVGIVHARDVLAALLAKTPLDLRSLAREPLVAPTTQPLARFILEAQGSRRHCAIVVDERGSTVGMAFLEDALEEIVGPIHDEFDQTANTVRELPDGSTEFSGSLPLPDVARLIDVEFDQDTDTIAGYVIARLGRLPKQGDELKVRGFRIVVAGMSMQRVTRVRFEPMETESESEDENV